MMVDADEGSPLMEVGNNDNFGADDIWAMLHRASPQDSLWFTDALAGNNDNYGADDIWAMLDRTSPQDSLWFTDALAGVQNSEEVRWIDDTPESGVVSSQHILALESRGASSNGFVESVWSPSIANSEMIKTPFYVSQGNNLSHLHELLQAEDGTTGFDVVPPHGSIEASESSKGRSDVSSGPAWGSSFLYGEMPEPSSQISQGNGLFYKPADDSSQNASSYENDSKKASFETPYHRELFNLCGANHVIQNQQSSDKNGRNKVPFETPNYGDTPCFLGFNNAIHKQDSSDFIYPNHEDYPVGINIDLNTFSDSVSRASKVVDGAIYPSASEDETKDGILESRRALPSLSMAGGTTIKNSFVAAHDRHSVLHVSEHPKMETEESEFKDSSLSEIDNPGVQNNTFERGKTEDDSDLCILEDLSAPARSNRVATKVKLVTAKQNSTSSHPGTQKVTTHAKRRPNNERVIFRVALQDLSQPKLEATLPDGDLEGEKRNLEKDLEAARVAAAEAQSLLSEIEQQASVDRVEAERAKAAEELLKKQLAEVQGHLQRAQTETLRLTELQRTLLTPEQADEQVSEASNFAYFCAYANCLRGAHQARPEDVLLDLKDDFYACLRDNPPAVGSELPIADLQDFGCDFAFLPEGVQIAPPVLSEPSVLDGLEGKQIQENQAAAQEQDTPAS